MRDEETRRALGPDRAADPRRAAHLRRRHGQGYSRFEHTAHGIALELLQFVPLDDPVKISRLQLANRSGRGAAPVGHGLRRVGARHVAQRTRAVRRHRARRRRPARSSRAIPGTATSATRVAFADLGGRQTRLDRRSHRVPRPQRHARRIPAALGAARRSPAASAPASTRARALQTPRRARARASATEVVFLLGQAATTDEARALVARYRAADLDARAARGRTSAGTTLLGAVQVKTPDRSLDLLLNRWLLYQTLACRIWARSRLLPGERRLRLPRPAPGRAWRSRVARPRPRARAPPARRRAPVRRGRRAALVACRPRAAACARASPTTCSGCRTSSRTTSTSPAMPPILDERCRSSTGRALAAGRARGATSQPDGLERDARRCYEHCARALDRGLAVGAHGLPLMGTGDWNDGMNRVGAERQGRERLARLVPARDALRAFAPLAERARRRRPRGGAGARTPTRSQAALERDGWDGDWYRRAYFDDGTPLGSAPERRVPDRLDRAVLGGDLRRGRPGRARARAMAAVDEHLVRRERRARRCSSRRPSTRRRTIPGYIKGYPPGIRENGGQYTHAALWAVLAFAAARRRRPGRRAVRAC